MCVDSSIPFIWRVPIQRFSGDAQTRKAVSTWTVGSEIDHQQVGNTWSGESNLVSLSMSGELNIFDPRLGDKATNVLSVCFSAVSLSVSLCETPLLHQAPQRSINVITPTKGASSGTFLAGTADGRVYAYSESSKGTTLVEGKSHSNNVSGIVMSPVDGTVYSIGFDDHVREISADGLTFLFVFLPPFPPPTITSR